MPVRAARATDLAGISRRRTTKVKLRGKAALLLSAILCSLPVARPLAFSLSPWLSLAPVPGGSAFKTQGACEFMHWRIGALPPESPGGWRPPSQMFH